MSEERPRYWISGTDTTLVGAGDVAVMMETLSSDGVGINIIAGQVMRCRDCAHWSRPFEAQYGHCYRQGPGEAMLAQRETTRGYQDAMLWTKSNFGCSEATRR